MGPAHVRLTALGEFRNGAGTTLDIWQASISLSGGQPAAGTPDSAPFLLADQNTLATAGYTFFKAILLDFACQQGVHLTGCKAATIMPSGKYATFFNDGSDYVPSIEGTDFTVGPSAAVAYPSEVALAVTLRTRAGTGKGSGRFYYPMPGEALTDFTLTSAQTNALATQVASAVDTMELATLAVPSAWAAGGWSLSVASTKPTPRMRAVQEIAVGGVPDVQRRRRNKMLEEYSAHVV